MPLLQQHILYTVYDTKQKRSPCSASLLTTARTCGKLESKGKKKACHLPISNLVVHLPNHK